MIMDTEYYPKSHFHIVIEFIAHLKCTFQKWYSAKSQINFSILASNTAI